MTFQNAKHLYMTALGIMGHQQPPDLKPAPSMFPPGADVSTLPTLPDGIHLRWLFGRERGFPKGGYCVFRRSHPVLKPEEVVYRAVTAIAVANYSLPKVSGY